MYNYSNDHKSLLAAGYSEDSDYTSDVNFPVNGHFPNAPASQYLQVSPCSAVFLRFIYLQQDSALSFAFVFVLIQAENQLFRLLL